MNLIEIGEGQGQTILYKIVNFPETFSTGPRFLIWLWIIKVKGPKNKVGFLKVLYVVVTGPYHTF